MSLPSQIQKARDLGYSVDEIVDYLGNDHEELSPKIKKAKDYGYSSQEILQHLEAPSSKEEYYEGLAKQQSKRQVSPDFSQPETRDAWKNMGLQALSQATFGASENNNLLGATGALLQAGNKDLKPQFKEGQELHKTAGNFLGNAIPITAIESTLVRPLQQWATRNAANFIPKLVKATTTGAGARAIAYPGKEVLHSFLSGEDLPSADELANNAVMISALGAIGDLGEAGFDLFKGIEDTANAAGTSKWDALKAWWNQSKKDGGIASDFEKMATGKQHIPQSQPLYEEMEKSVSKMTPAPSLPVEEDVSLSKSVFDKAPSPISAAPLEGRVTEGGVPLGVKPVGKPSQESSDVRDMVGYTVSPYQIENTSKAGEGLVKTIGKEAEKEYQDVNKLYDKSETLNQYVNDIHPEMVDDLEEHIRRYENVPPQARSAPEKKLVSAVNGLIKKAASFDKEGNITGFMPISNQALIDTARSLRRSIDFDFAQGNPSKIMVPVINILKKAIEKAAQSDKAALEAYQTAQEAYKKWASKYDTDYIRPLRDLSNKDFSKIAKSALNIDEYRQISPVLKQTKEGRQLADALLRRLVEDRLDKFFKDPRGVDMRAFNREIAELRPVLSDKKIKEISDTMRHARLPNIRRHVRQLKRPKNETQREPREAHPFPTPERIRESFKRRTEIKRLRHEMTRHHDLESFNRYAKDAIDKILKGGGVFEKKLTAEDLYAVLNDTDKNNILRELVSNEVINNLEKIAKSNVSSGKKLKLLKSFAQQTMRHVAGSSLIYYFLSALFHAG